MRLSPLRRGLGPALAASLLLLGASACKRGDREGDTKVLVIGKELKLADPAAGELTAPQQVLLENIAQGLVRFDARGEIVPGLAERWNVSDDGLSYIFRIASGDWPGGGHITAKQIAALIAKQVASGSKNPLKDPLGAVSDVVAMTDRVIEIRLSAPRPNLLEVLAQPEFALVKEGRGTGPFMLRDAKAKDGSLRLSREEPIPDSEDEKREDLELGAADATAAIVTYRSGGADLVLGGRFTDLPYVHVAGIAKDAVRFDPVAGLFGLVPAKDGGPLADPEVRKLLSQAIDRQALIEVLQVPGLFPRGTVLQAGLDGVADPVQPAWVGTPLDQRRASLVAAADRIFGDKERPTLRVALPAGPGAKLLRNRLRKDWGAFGIGVEAVAPGEAADLKLIDDVAPSSSPAWFLRHFRCGVSAICDPEIDALLEAARSAQVPDQRWALLADAARQIDEQQFFLSLAAPVRWSLVAPRITGFAGNRFARHTLTGLQGPLSREGSD